MKKISVLFLFLWFCHIVSAQNNEVSMVVSGEGKDKNEATFNALRSAIEQVCGTFISANTTILNDKLVADEMVSLSSGNIKNYEYISETTQSNGNVYVTLKASVCVDKLTTFCESKGMTAELKGATFAMNIKKMEFDKLAEEKAVENLCKQLKTMLPTLFDYKIEVKEPRLASSYKQFRNDHPKIFNADSTQLYEVPFTVKAVPNENFTIFFKILFNSLFEISLTTERAADYWKINQPVYSLSFDFGGLRRDINYFFASLEEFNRSTREECLNDRYTGSFDYYKDKLSDKYLSHLDHSALCFRSQKSIANITLLEYFFGINIFRDVLVEDGLSTINCTGISLIKRPTIYDYENDFISFSNEELELFYWCRDYLPVTNLCFACGRGYCDDLIFDYKTGKFREEAEDIESYNSYYSKYYNDDHFYKYFYFYDNKYFLYWTKGIAEVKVVNAESWTESGFFSDESFSFKGSLFYTLDEMSKIKKITVHREEESIIDEDNTFPIQETNNPTDNNISQIQENANYSLYADTLQQVVNNYNTLLKQYPYNYQENRLSYTLPKELLQQENLLRDTLHILLETINTKMAQLKERYQKDSTEYAQLKNQFYGKLAEYNKELLAYPYNQEKHMIIDSLPISLFGKSNELSEVMQKKNHEWQEKREQMEQEVRTTMRANNPQKFVDIYFSQAANKKEDANKLYLECRCKYTDRLSFDLAYIDNSLEACNCRQSKYDEVKALYHSREEFDQSYNQAEPDFEREITDRKQMMSAKSYIEEILFNNKQMNLKQAKASSKEDVQLLLMLIDKQKGKYYYMDVMDLVFELNDKLAKEWVKNGSLFQSKAEMFEFYIEEDYNKVLKQRKKE